jgi:hypothetical protein
MHELADNSATRLAFNLAMAASLMKGCPDSFNRAALYTNNRALSISMATFAYCI